MKQDSADQSECVCAVGWIMSPQHSQVKVLTPSISGCDGFEILEGL